MQNIQERQEYENYKKIKLLGEGSFGKAFLVERMRDGLRCVMKQIDIQKMSEQERRETVQESRILEALSHPNIVRFIEVFKTKKGKLCIVMDFADGGDLQNRAKEQRGRNFSENQVLDWFTQICLGLKHIHDRKILHRDLKGQNVFLTKQGIVKIGDFGIAKVLKNTMQNARTVVGTPYYLSPELVSNKPYSFKSDIWSLGVILYELCALKPPFDAPSLHFLAMKIVRGAINPLPTMYSKELKNLVQSMLNTNASLRPDVNKILAMPLIQNRIKTYLTETVYKSEFSHTILHKQNVFDQKQHQLQQIQTLQQAINSQKTAAEEQRKANAVQYKINQNVPRYQPNPAARNYPGGASPGVQAALGQQNRPQAPSAQAAKPNYHYAAGNANNPSRSPAPASQQQQKDEYKQIMADIERQKVREKREKELAMLEEERIAVFKEKQRLREAKEEREKREREQFKKEHELWQKQEEIARKQALQRDDMERKRREEQRKHTEKIIAEKKQLQVKEEQKKREAEAAARKRENELADIRRKEQQQQANANMGLGVMDQINKVVNKIDSIDRKIGNKQQAQAFEVPINSSPQKDAAHNRANIKAPKSASRPVSQKQPMSVVQVAALGAQEAKLQYQQEQKNKIKEERDQQRAQMRADIAAARKAAAKKPPAATKKKADSRPEWVGVGLPYLPDDLDKQEEGKEEEVVEVEAKSKSKSPSRAEIKIAETAIQPQTVEDPVSMKQEPFEYKEEEAATPPPPASSAAEQSTEPETTEEYQEVYQMYDELLEVIRGGESLNEDSAKQEFKRQESADSEGFNDERDEIIVDPKKPAVEEEKQPLNVLEKRESQQSSKKNYDDTLSTVQEDPEEATMSLQGPSINKRNFGNPDELAAEDRDDLEDDDDDDDDEDEPAGADRKFDPSRRMDFTFADKKALMTGANVMEDFSKFQNIEQTRLYLEKELGEQVVMNAYPILRDFGDNILFDEKEEELAAKLQGVMNKEQMQKYKQYLASWIFLELEAEKEGGGEKGLISAFATLKNIQTTAVFGKF